MRNTKELLQFESQINGAVDWDDITDKPTEFPTAAHAHSDTEETI